MDWRFTRPYGTTDAVYFTLRDPSTAELVTTASFVAGDMQWSLDGVYSWVPVAAESQGSVSVVTLIDSATKVWHDTTITIETHGAGTTTFGFDLSASAPDVNLFSVNDSQANAIRLGELIGTSKKGTIKSATTPTATSFVSANFETTGNDKMNSRMGVFITGTFAGMPFYVADQQTDTPGAGDETFTVAPMPNTPAAGNEFIIL
jgi:hypothetical protein